jgi:hypothetical protein
MAPIIDLALIQNGCVLTEFPLEECVRIFVQERRWKELDNYFLEISKPNGLLNNFLKAYLDFSFLEHIIAIRTAPTDDEGIWHDDGSRFIGFSLSLNLAPETIEGGELYFRKKESTEMSSFKPLPFGKIVIFLSGVYGYEHKVTAVTKSERIIIAGWCSEGSL